jgi:hypothetical protein
MEKKNDHDIEIGSPNNTTILAKWQKQLQDKVESIDTAYSLHESPDSDNFSGAHIVPIENLHETYIKGEPIEVDDHNLNPIDSQNLNSDQL